ncbi:MAG TPA: DnaD domain protein [Clostridia bacterium]|nr:DnaD domain protein [Clostridia bacterium]
MNLFRIKSNNEDLGQTLVENLFISHYMPSAPANHVKVYLLGLKYSQSYVNNMLSTDTIAKTLKLSCDEVSTAWRYWSEQGIVRLYPYTCAGAEDGFTVEYLNIKELMLNIKEKNETSGRYSPERIINARGNHVIREMFDSFRKLFGRELSPNELFVFLDWMDDYNFPTSVIQLLVEDCIGRDKKDLPYLKQVAKNWFDAGIDSVDKAVQYNSRHKEKWQKYNKVLSFLRLGRQPTSAEEELLQKWFYTFEYSEDIVLKACELTAKTLKPSFNYIDKILCEWHGKGLSSIQEIDAYLLKEPKGEKKAAKGQKPSFNNFTNRTYDAKALEEAWLKKSRGEVSE